MKKELLKEDFYEAINQSWEQKAKIPSDRGATGAFYEIFTRNEKILKDKITKELRAKLENRTLENQSLINFVNFFNMTSNFAKRKELGIAPLKKELEIIWNLKNLQEFKNLFINLRLKEFVLPYSFDIMQDFKDSTIQTLAFGEADLILPDKSYYDEKNPNKKILIESFKSMSYKLLQAYFDDEQVINKIIEQTLEFDNSLVEQSLSAQEKANYVSLYNPYQLEELKAKMPFIDFGTFINQVIKKEVKQIIIPNKRFVNLASNLINEKTFKNIKSWIYLQTVIKYSPYLDEKTRILASEFARKLNGIAKPSNKNKSAFYQAYGYFKMPVGLYYGQTYFGPEAKKDVETKVKRMIEIYKRRIENNSWLSQATKEKAILKLSTLGIHIGYPSQLKPYYKDLIVQGYEDKGNLISNIFRFNEIISKFTFSRYHEKINKEIWEMSPAEVNAYYHPFMNHIVFPAGILNAPFYSAKQTSSQNYGGIGAVIAHEISHAFDNNGANFDENGNLNMWWTPEDFRKFNDLAQKMINLFEGVKTQYGKCNGALTVSENIADAGGISCALEASMLEAKHSSKQFFYNWAKIWRGKFKPETAKRLLATDVHAPQKLRANQQVKNLEEFYKTFKIKKGDKMYLEPKKRVSIW